MAEVVFNIAGMRAPVVLTCANRALGAPINIWNDQQDSLTFRDSGWIMQYAEDNQEAIDLHLQAFKIAEKMKLPVMINLDGFVLTHTYENIDLPTQAEVDKFVPKYKLDPGFYIDPKKPASFGYFATPKTYMEQRQELFDDLMKSKQEIVKVAVEFTKKFKRDQGDGLVEYIGNGKEKVVLVSFGSTVGTMRESQKSKVKSQKFGILKIRTFRPFPVEETIRHLRKAKYVAVIEKDISLGNEGILATEIKAACLNKTKAKIQSFIVGLGGKDVTLEVINKIVKEVQQRGAETRWMYP